VTLASPDDAPSIADRDFRLMAESIPHIVWMAGADGSTRYLNRQGMAFTGCRADTPEGWSWSSLTHPDDVDRVREAWEHSTWTKTPFAIDCRVRRFDGQYRWHAFRSRHVSAPRGAVIRWIGTATDIEDAKRSDADLRLAERATAETLTVLETVLSKAPVGFAFVDRDYRVVRMNETLAAVAGSTVAELLGRTVATVVPKLWAQIEPRYQQVLQTGEAIRNVEIAGMSEADALSRHWLMSYYPVALDDELIGIAILALDITQLRLAETTRQQLAAIVDGSGDAIFGSTMDGTVTSWNGAAERLFGFTAEEIIGQAVAAIAPPGGTDEQAQLRARLNAGGAAERFETTRRRRDGSLVEVQITASPATDKAGNVVGLSVVGHDITERRAEQRALEVSQHGLAEAQRIAHLGSFEFDIGTGELTWSEEYYRVLGLDRALSPSIALFVSALHPDDLEAVGEAWRDVTERGVPFDLEIRIIRPNSDERVVHTRGVAQVADDGGIVKVAGTLMDETERVEAENVRRTAETRFEISFEQAAIGAAIADLEGIPVRVNPAMCAFFGRPVEALVGRRWTEYTHPDELPLGQAVLVSLAAGHDVYEDERRYLRPDGTIVWALAHATVVRDETGAPQYFFTQLQDITGRKQMEDELAHQALHDSLTGLPNRALLTDRLVHGLARSRRRGSQLGVMFLDVDHFKVVNDSLGHTSGDHLLRIAADRIASAIRPGDTVARFGGDEFVVVCDDVSALETELIGQRVLDALSRPCLISGQEMNVTASLGIAVANEDATPESLLRDSDAAMYRAKERGRARIEMFDETLRHRTEQRLGTSSALHHALDRNEFTVDYQPIIDLSTGAMVCAEALLRWNHPERGSVSPAEFIPLAEETGLIVPIGAWVLEQACGDLMRWQRTLASMSDAGNLSVAVNLSVRQMLSSDIAGLVADVLARTGVHAGDLWLELTESVFMEDVDYFERTLASLKRVGVRLAIDDFGTGYSSLSYLKRFPVDAVKVDRSFVDGLGTDPHDSALVGAIVAMADALGLEVTAEGVETQNQLANLKRLHCRRAQGFYMARPMSADSLMQLVVESHRWNV
jgi:diguanylate cyclase (GGDEF)-like protein/PAS domain S-box-containing protein